MKNSHINITIKGKVQGVGFRIVTRNEARKRNLHGFVMNECDGNVYIEAEGDAEQLKEFIKFCHTGPPAAKVSNVEIEEGKIKNYSVFEIRH